MSRCFPFPPPGYEKKSINGNGNAELGYLDKETKHENKKKKEKKEKRKDEEKVSVVTEKREKKHKHNKNKKDKNKDKKHKNKYGGSEQNEEKREHGIDKLMTKSKNEGNVFKYKKRVGDTQDISKKRETDLKNFVVRDRHENGECDKICLPNREGSRHKLDNGKTRDNVMELDQRIDKDRAMSNDNGNGLWIHLPVLTDKDKRSNKRPRIEVAEEIHYGNGRTVQDEKAHAFKCIPKTGVQEESNAAHEKHISATTCHQPFCSKDCDRNHEANCKSSSHSVVPVHCNTVPVDFVPSRNRTDNHVQDLKHFYSVPSNLDWSDADDQAWLFHHNNKKPKATVRVDHGPNVWAHALHLQVSNIYALPYVIQL